MCYAIHHIHNKCRHYKKVEVIEDCEKAEEGPCVLVPILFKYINSPSLCVSCFREEEAKIDAVHNEMVAQLEYAMTKEKEWRDRKEEATIDAVYNERVAQLEYALAMEKESRGRQIQKFRSEQSVWGDG